MKVTFVYPRFEKFLQSLPELDSGLVDYFLGNFTTPPSLGIPILASLTPPEVEVELVDDNSGQPVDFNAPTDLVAINCSRRRPPGRWSLPTATGRTVGKW